MKLVSGQQRFLKEMCCMYSREGLGSVRSENDGPLGEKGLL